MAAQIDWPHLMRLGLGTLRLTPEVFWAMTPVEFLAALQGAGLIPTGGAMDRNVLETLMTAFPDMPAEKDTD